MKLKEKIIWGILVIQAITAFLYIISPFFLIPTLIAPIPVGVLSCIRKGD